MTYGVNLNDTVVRYCPYIYSHTNTCNVGLSQNVFELNTLCVVLSTERAKYIDSVSQATAIWMGSLWLAQVGLNWQTGSTNRECNNGRKNYQRQREYLCYLCSVYLMLNKGCRVQRLAINRNSGGMCNQPILIGKEEEGPACFLDINVS